MGGSYRRGMSKPVSDSEVDYQRHDPYLAVIGKHAEPLGDAVMSMTRAAGREARAGTRDAIRTAAAMVGVRSTAAAFLANLSRTRCPEYMRGADAQLHDALKLQVDAADRGAAAARSADDKGLHDAAREMSTATDDFFAAAAQLADWSSAARPWRGDGP